MKSKIALVMILLVMVGAFFSGLQVVQAQTEAAHPVEVIFFWRHGCPHCAEEEEFFEELKQEYPNLNIEDYEVSENASNLDLMVKMSEEWGFKASGVPLTFIGNRYWVGFNKTIAEEMTAMVELCSESVCEAKPDSSMVIDLPIFGKIDLNRQSLLISTLLISFVDGFNPCSLWVLSMLMALVVHTGSRKKIFIIGFVFLTVTAAIYALFIAGIFTIIYFISFIKVIQVIVSVVALVFALINIKDYFWYKEGVSLTIADEKKPGIFKRMRTVMNNSNSIWGLLGATIVMGAGVSLVEFSCTAGFPVVWSNLLNSLNVSPSTFGWLLLVYMLVYQIDEIVIFLVVVFTLRASKFEEKQGRVLKLFGGTLMLSLSAVMLINPDVMNNLSSSLLVFGVAIMLSLLVLLVHRVILPRFGINIGTEQLAAAKDKPEDTK